MVQQRRVGIATRMRFLWLVGVVIALVITGLLSREYLFDSPSSQAAIMFPMSSATRTPAPKPTPTSTLDPAVVAQSTLSRNALMGCLHGAPPPMTNVVWTGRNLATNKPAPNEVALTFDDGPTPYSTPQMLDMLEKTHTPATFFVEGQYVANFPDLLRREWNDGFAIGAHSWDHPLMTHIFTTDYAHQFGDTMRAIHQVLGENACIWFWRPPYGDYNTTIINQANSYHLTTITWDLSVEDWNRPGAGVIANRVIAALHPGAIILLHDGPAAREQTIAAIPAILAGLRARGLTPVTLPRLLADAGYPGVNMSVPGAGANP